MEYKGELYGKIGKHYFPLELTADNVDRLESIIIELRKDIDNKAGQIADLTSLIQEESIEFGEWLRNNEWSFAAFENEWVNLKDDKLIFKTTSELYNSKEYQEYRNKQ